MAKKLTIFDRRKLLEARERGLTDSEIKAQFGITDDRTLRRHLKLAEQEQEARLVKIEMLKDALASHLGEVRTLLEQWKNALRKPQFDEVYPGTPSPTGNIEASPLFNSLREHLPFPTLWRNFSSYAKKMDEYITGIKNLRKEIEEEIKNWQNVQDATTNATQPILKRILDKALGKKIKDYHFKGWTSYKDLEKKELADVGSFMVDDIKVLEASDLTSRRKKQYDKLYQEISDQTLANQTTVQLITLYNDLKPLEVKIHEDLQEILLRRDYIMYTCSLCPGQPRLVR